MNTVLALVDRRTGDALVLVGLGSWLLINDAMGRHRRRRRYGAAQR